jgi:hypothetical protein
MEREKPEWVVKTKKLDRYDPETVFKKGRRYVVEEKISKNRPFMTDFGFVSRFHFYPLYLLQWARSAREAHKIRKTAKKLL